MSFFSLPQAHFIPFTILFVNYATIVVPVLIFLCLKIDHTLEGKKTFLPMCAHTNKRWVYKEMHVNAGHKIFRARNNWAPKNVKIDEQIIGFSGGISIGFTFAKTSCLVALIAVETYLNSYLLLMPLVRISFSFCRLFSLVESIDWIKSVFIHKFRRARVLFDSRGPEIEIIETNKCFHISTLIL